MVVALISEQDTWISIDPIRGCPATCDYCYLGALDLRARKPFALVEPNAAVDALAEYFGDRDDLTPVAIGNYTDMVMTPQNRAYLREFAKLFSERFRGRPLVVITKSAHISSLARDLAEIKYPILIFLSFSFAQELDPSLERGAILSWSGLLEAIVEINRHSTLTAIHFWRPFIAALNPMESLAGRVRALRSAGASASVIVGYKGSTAIAEPWSPRTKSLLGSRDIFMAGSETIPPQVWSALVDRASAEGYPVYRHTSCSVALAGNRPEALRTMSGPGAQHYCRSTTCPSAQRSTCAAFEADGPSERRITEALSLLPVDTVNRGYRLDGWHLTVNGVVPESSLSKATHISGLAVRSTEVKREKAWLNSDLSVHSDLSMNGETT